MPASTTRPRSLRLIMLLPLALLLASVASCCMSYADARRVLSDDLNDAMVALTRANSDLWTRQDTIAALRQISATTHQPLILQASDATFRHAMLRERSFVSLQLVDGAPAAHVTRGDLSSDSIMLMPAQGAEGVAVRVQGFAMCSMAAVLAVSDQRLPAALFVLSLLSAAGVSVLYRRSRRSPQAPSLDGIKLTPMQRQLAQMMLDAPGLRVQKAALCAALWGNKSNAEESLYTLVRRTKAALAPAGIDIVCNRGESYELRINP